MATSLIDRVRSAMKRPSPTIPQLADALADARRADTDARAAVDKAQAVVAAGFLDAADKRQADRDALAKAREAAEDAGLVLAEVERRHTAAVEADEQERRRAVYAGAKQLADDAALALAKSYPALARGMISMLRDLATAQQAVALANADLPADVVPIMDPETSARAAMGAPREIVSDEWVEAWGSVEAMVPLPDEYQAQVYDCGNGWGKRGDYDGGLQSQGEPKPNYRRRRFHKVTFRECENGSFPRPLACAIRLPAVRGDGMLWGNAHLVQDPALSAVMAGEGDPVSVLARVADLDAAATAKPVKAERPLQVEYPEYQEVVAWPEEQPSPDRHRALSPARGSRFGASPYASPGARAGARR